MSADSVKPVRLTYQEPAGETRCPVPQEGPRARPAR